MNLEDVKAKLNGIKATPQAEVRVAADDPAISTPVVGVSYQNGVIIIQTAPEGTE